MNPLASTVNAPLSQTEAEELVRPGVQLLPPWDLILHNDQVHWAHDVVAALVQTISGLVPQRAWDITWEAHSTGQALVISCPRELAELYQERLQGFGLTITIEPQR
jgi:ATP-dependent Clp protease adaptor protein ClpS